MPKRLMLVGLLFLLIGAVAAWEMIADVMNSRLTFVPWIVLLPVGMGVFGGSRNAVGWAKLFVVLGYAVCGVIVYCVVKFPELAHAGWGSERLEGSEAVPYVIVGVVVLAVVLYLLQRALWSREVSEYVRGNVADMGGVGERREG